MSGLLRKKEFNGSGSRVIFDFIEEFQEEFKERIFKYAEAKLPYLDDGGFEHGFYYGEQQTKTFVTSSLDSICNSEVMQEYSVDRRKKDDKEESDVEGNGNVDYWCRYGVSTKTSILIEVKQSWIRYYDKKKYTLYSSALERHMQAIKQIKSIKNISDVKIDNLYTVALTLLPIFVRYKSDDEKRTIGDDVLHGMCEDILKKIKDCHAVGFFSIPDRICPVDSWELDDGKTIYENHPGFVFVYNIYKKTRK